MDPLDLDDLDEDPEYSFVDRFLMFICQYISLFYLALIFEIVFMLYTLLSFLFADLDEETHAIVMLNFVIISIAMVITVGLILGCKGKS